MRKNYFAKKFVAYSMAFAVAFSSLTVSPVFVKDAKAGTIPAASSKMTVAIAAGQYLVGDINSNLTGASATGPNVTLEEVATDTQQIGGDIN